MRRTIRCGAILGFVVLAALMAAGCGGGKGTDSLNMTKEEQYETIEGFLDYMLDPMMDQVGIGFWDGIQREDIDYPLAIGGLGKRLVTDDSISLSYDFQKGWWFVYAHLEADSEGSSLEFTRRDSIRFETAAGMAQLEPDSETHRFFHGGSQEGELVLMFGSEGLAISLAARGGADVSGLTGAVANANGDMTALVSVESVGREPENYIIFDATGDLRNLTVPIGDDCPTGGELDVQFGLTLDVTDESGHRIRGSDDWSLSAAITGGNSVTVQVVSDDFSTTITEPICD